MKNWMKKLASHFEKTRARHPKDGLLLLFDIDGTIIDTRHLIQYAIKRYDQNHNTDFANKLQQAYLNNNNLENIFKESEYFEKIRKNILDWFTARHWSSEEIIASYKPFEGVMEVIRWFQMQPNTFVGLNTGRPESLRTHTLNCLNKVAGEYKVHFSNDLLFMNPHGWGNRVVERKAKAVEYFWKSGYKIFAMVDNEPENLYAIAEVDLHREILLLHADTIFESKRNKLPSRSSSGKFYDITELIQEKSLPQHIQFVWHGVNDLGNLIQFLHSNIKWAECDLRIDASTKEVILCSDNIAGTDKNNKEDWVRLNDLLFAVVPSNKSIKLDFKENGPLIEAVIACLEEHEIDETRLWFSGKMDVLKEDGFHRLRHLYPKAILQCPIDEFIPIILKSPKEAQKILSILRNWGINRFSVKWNRPRLREIIDRLDSFGMDVNIYQVPDLASFLKAVLLMPRSVTSDFNFPKWHYFGRPSQIEYDLEVYPEGAKHFAQVASFLIFM